MEIDLEWFLSVFFIALMMGAWMFAFVWLWRSAGATARQIEEGGDL